MLFFKRREVYMGASAKEFAEVRRKLAASRIPYDIRSVNRFGGDLGGSRTVMGTMNERTEYMNLHYVYVNKKDYERAMQLLHTK